MLIGRIEGCTRVLGQSQGYLGLPLRDGVIHCSVGGPDTPAMVTAWHPTPAELERLNEGASVHLTVLGSAHPPVMLSVGGEAGRDPIDARISELLEANNREVEARRELRIHLDAAQAVLQLAEIHLISHLNEIIAANSKHDTDGAVIPDTLSPAAAPFVADLAHLLTSIARVRE